MKRLTLFRHAKSGWDDPAARDFDRALNDKGRRAARTMGRAMRDAGLHFDRAIASPAVRVVETLDAMFEGYGRRVATDWDRRVYLASDATLLEVVQGAPAEVDHLLLAGHNPGMEDLALMLVPNDGGDARDAVEEKFPTAAFATIGFGVGEWEEVERGGGMLESFVRPRDVDPLLGPNT